MKINNESISKFFFKESNDEKERIQWINFLYESTKQNINEYENKILSETTIKWIRKSEDEKKVRIPIIHELIFNRLLGIKDYRLVLENQEDLHKNWVECIKSVETNRKRYIDKINNSNVKIKYFIFSETPLLNLQTNNFYSEYIFSERNVGSYRTVPFSIISKLEKSSRVNDEINGDNIIDLFAEIGVAFIDLIPIPLPKIHSDLRKKNAFDIYYTLDGKKPRLINFLEIAVENFFKEAKCEIENEIGIAFMMPPISAMGIIDWIKNPYTTDYFDSNKLKEITNNIINKDIDWWKNRIANGKKSGFPEGSLLETALKEKFKITNSNIV